MKERRMSIREFLKRFDRGDFDSKDVNVQIEAGWWDWFCKDSALRNKTYYLAKKLKSLLPSPKIDIDKTYVWFKNNCLVSGKLYDDFRISDLKTGDVLYTIIPKDPTAGNKAAVWGYENDFSEPLVVGSWKDVVHFFKSKR